MSISSAPKFAIATTCLLAFAWTARSAIDAPAGSGGREQATAARLARAEAEPQNWLSYGRTYSEQRYGALDQIAVDNVSKLGLTWHHDLDTARGQESTPLVVDGVMYVTTAWSKVVALDATTGKTLWQFDPQVPGKFALNACCDVINRGAAYNDGRVYVGTIDGRLIAIDAKTGKQLWSAVTTDQTKPYTITGAPRVARGKVFIGNGGAEYGVRGYVSAYDEKTGKLDWRFYFVPGQPGKKDHAASDDVLETMARPTWFGDYYWKIGGGGTAWDSIVYDPEFNRLYVGTGNGGPWNQKIRSEGKGDNLFLGSIVALDPDTGKYVWHYQENPGENWDFTSTQQITLADLPIDGKPRKVLMHAPKNGFFYVIDRATGKLISADKFMPANWAERVDLKTGRPVENPDARYKDKPFLATIGSSGAHNWFPMSYSPKTGYVYIPAQQVSILYVGDKAYRYRPGLWALGIDLAPGPLPATPKEIAAAEHGSTGKLVAWDPVARKEVWSVPREQAWNGGTLSTAGNLVFQGLRDETFRAYDARNGKEVWRFDTQSQALPGAITYSVNGTQYIAVVAGFGASGSLLPNFGRPKVRPTGRVLVFKLGGTDKLPPVEGTIAPLNPATGEHWTPQQVAEGDRLFNHSCSACHSPGAFSAGVLPDLRRSAAVTNKEAWQQIVIGGALEDQGMVSFARYFTPAQAESLRAYVSHQAELAKKLGQ